jgi:hypothetical protein
MSAPLPRHRGPVKQLAELVALGSLEDVCAVVMLWLLKADGPVAAHPDLDTAAITFGWADERPLFLAEVLSH